MTTRLYFDQGPDGQPVGFSAPSSVITAQTPDDVPAAFDAIRAATADGKWVAGMASYELGYVVMPKLLDRMPENRTVPLLQFGVFDGPVVDDRFTGAADISDVTPTWDAATYARAFDTVHDYIGAGDIYQANLTFPITARTSGTGAETFATLAARQPVSHGAFADFGDGTVIVSRSPELFFNIDADGYIETRPMKGTMPRGATEKEDNANNAWLAQDEKNRAENLMIVDLLRNDLSRISQVGTVKVPALFSVETYATVHQMVSHVRARLQSDVGLPEILTALFPCGSITGAPKLRAMEIIRDLEPAPRDIYCGTMGWFAPDGRASFNVAIRTLMVSDTGDVRLNVGGGVVYDSTATSEYEEALWKARFLSPKP